MGPVCWDPCREGHINALDRIQKMAAQFKNHTKVSDWETLDQLRTIESLCALFKSYCGERAWRAISDRLQMPYYLSRFGHVRKSRVRKKRPDIVKNSFVNRTIKNWNQIPAEALGTYPCEHNNFRKRVWKAIISGMKRKE